MRIVKYDHKISVIDTSIKIAVSKRFDLTDLDRSICWLLKEAGNLSIESLGVILGIGTIEFQFPESDGKIHKDVIEIELLKSLLSQVEAFHLIDFKDKNGSVILTDQGERALETGNKYQYFDAYYSHYNLLDISLESGSEPFPYHRLGLVPKIHEGQPEKKLPDYLSETLSPDHRIDQIQTALNLNYPEIRLEKLVDQNLGKMERLISVSVEVNLESGEVSFNYNEQPIEELNSAIRINENSRFKEFLIQKARYLDYVRTEQAFDLSQITHFSKYTFFNFNKLIESNLINWTPELIEFVVSWDGADSGTWYLISSNCPIKLILGQLDLVSDFIDWSLLTHRCIDTPEIILSNWNLTWDSEQVLTEFDQKNLENFLKILQRNLNIEEVVTRFTPDQWVLLTSLLSDSFLNNHIYNLPLDFRFISRERSTFTQKLIISSNQWKTDPWSRELDWSYISENYDLDFLAKNYSQIQESVDPKTLLIKLGQFPDRLLKFLKSSRTRPLREKLNKENFRVGCDTSLIFNSELLARLDELDLLQWGNQFFKGVEHNCNIEWNDSLIYKYKNRLKNFGEQQISINIDSLWVIKRHPDLNWDEVNLLAVCKVEEFENFFLEWCDENSPKEWSALLINRLDLDLGTIIRILSITNWLSEYLDWIMLLARYDVIDSKHFEHIFLFIEDAQVEVRSYLSSRINLNLVFEYCHLEWDWSVITNRMMDEGVDSTLYQVHVNKVDWKQIISSKYSNEDLVKYDVVDELKPILDSASNEMRKKACTYITQVYLDLTIIEDHFDQNRDYFDWELISQNQAFIMRLMRKAISGDFTVFHSISNYVDKAGFTRNTAFLRSLKKLEVESWQGWKKRVENLLSNLEGLIDWEVLSSEREFSSYEFLIKLFRNKLDWTGVSASSNIFLSKDQRPNIEVINKYKDVIDFYALTSRSDLIFDNEFIKAYNEKQLNYSHLSIADNSVITEHLFYEKSETVSSITALDQQNMIKYSWDFAGLSGKSGFWDSGETISKYPYKPWDWKKVIVNSKVRIEHEVIREILNQKIEDSLNWFDITSRKNFLVSFKTLKSFNNKLLSKLNWDYISKQTGKWKYKEIIAFKDYWVWKSLAWLNNGSKKIKEIEDIIDLIDIGTLSRIIDAKDLFEDKDNKLKNIVDWSIICRRTDCEEYLYQKDNLENYCDYIDWTYLSSLTTFPFTIELLDSFSAYWNWFVLERNPVIKESFLSVVEANIGFSNKLVFIDRLSQYPSPWTGKVYHFTHVENALKILTNECLYSRNAVVDFNDSAGSVVGRRGTAHNYARFYFRPQTLTQFYNEQLGKDCNMPYYENAYRLELPKCPIPVFFQFDLTEILQKKEFDCYVSNGNMQTNYAKVFKIENAISVFDFEHVYEEETWNYRNATQQEFLIRNKFNFSNLKNYRLLVPDQFTKTYLELFISTEKIKKRILVAKPEHQIFHFENRSINIDSFSQNGIKISTDYRNKHHFEIVFIEEPQFEVLDGESLVMGTNRVKFSNRLKMKLLNSCNYKVDFYNELKKDPWTIVKTT